MPLLWISLRVSCGAMLLGERKRQFFTARPFPCVPLTEAMSSLKQIAAKENLAPYKKSIRFYKSFMESVRRHGRVREMEFMTLYFLSMKNPLIPLQFAPLGMKLMSKGKVSFEIPSKGSGALESIFRKVEELEKN